MAIFLVDLQFREKAKQVLTSRELAAVLFFLLFALVPWVEVMEVARGVANSTWWDGGRGRCPARTLTATLTPGPVCDGPSDENCKYY